MLGWGVGDETNEMSARVAHVKEGMFVRAKRRMLEPGQGSILQAEAARWNGRPNLSFAEMEMVMATR